jgi:peptidyl-prolyl cis-trans isomerase D
MSDFIHNKTSGFLVTSLIGILILSFMFTGYQAFEQGGASSNAVAKVGEYSVSRQEYEQEYNRQIEFFKQMFGGEISAKQIEAMKIKESTIRNLVQRKLMLKLSSEVGAYPSEEEVKNEIKNLPYFQTDGQFDINKYKGLLAANRLTPQEFEQDVINQIKMKGINDLSPEFPISEAYLSDLNKFKADKLDIDLISFTKDSVRKHVAVTPEEVTKFLSVETNKNRILSMYKERKGSLDKAEEVTARHILIKTDNKSEAEAKTQIEKIAKEVNAANFAKTADKYTEDPSGKGKGGSLGSFARGAMVPEFENVAFTQKVGTVSAPVKTNFGYHLILTEKKTPAVTSQLSDYQEKFAKEVIQKEKVEEIKKLTVSISNDLKKALESGNDKEVKKIVDTYTLSQKKADVNKVDGVSTGANLTAAHMAEIFSGDLSKSKVVLADDGSTIYMIKTYPKAAATAPAANAAKVAEETASLKNVLSRKMMEGLIKKLEKDTKVKVFSNMVQ